MCAISASRASICSLLVEGWLPSAAKFLACGFILALAGCGSKHSSDAVSPYARYLPQAPPSETNRVEFPEGYSIVSPVGWTTHMTQSEDWFKGSVADQIEISGKGAD